MFINRNKTFLIWLNEEDHIRVISIQKGASMRQVYARLIKGLLLLEKKLEFVKHERFGYLTFCPTNIGTGLRASVHVKLPKLKASSDRLAQLCETLNLQARSIHGEHGADSDEGIFDISNKIRIGKTEFDLVNAMYDGIKKLLNEEFATK